MIEKISKKQEKIQEKIQKQQELNDKDCRELTDEELDQIVGGMRTTPGAPTGFVLKDGQLEAPGSHTPIVAP